MSKSRIYRIWAGIKTRCFNLNYLGYKDYGGRGIKMFEGWIHDFQSFYEYVSKLENFGKEGYSLDRIDNNGNYEPGNLRWATKKEQQRNTRRNILVEYNGEKIILADAAQKVNIDAETLRSRMKAGDTGETLFRPVKKK